MSAVCLVLGCGDDSGARFPGQSCDVLELVANDLEGLDAVDCGTFRIEDEAIGGVDIPELTDARECVREQVAAANPFGVRWQFNAFEGPAARSYVGTPGEDELVLTEYASSPSPSGAIGTARVSCSDLRAMIPCDPGWQLATLCLECVDAEVTTLCDAE